MKRSFYTLLIATALTLPAAGALAQAAGAGMNAAASPGLSPGMGASAGSSMNNTSVNTTAGNVNSHEPSIQGKTGVGLEPDSNANGAAGIGTDTAATTGAGTGANTIAAPPSMPDSTMSSSDMSTTTPSTGAGASANNASAASTNAASNSNAAAASAMAHSGGGKAEVSATTLLKVQESLSSAGYLKTPADGKFGPRTAAALRKYQAANGLSATGKVDADTLNKLGLQMSDAGQTPSMGSAGAAGSTTGATGSTDNNISPESSAQ